MSPAKCVYVCLCVYDCVHLGEFVCQCVGVCVHVFMSVNSVYM